MKLLVTGSAGFIGENLLPLLDNHNVTTWDLIEGNDIFEEGFEEFVKMNDIVIHLAALTNVEQSKKTPIPFYLTNTFGTARVAELCLKHKKKLVYPSTLHIYHPWKTPYADSKYWAELFVQRITPFVPTVILRFYNVFGKGMNNNSGSIINLFLKEKPITVWGKGEATRDFIHVRDVVSIVRASLGKEWNGKIVDVGTGKGVSLKEVAETFSEFRKVPVVYENKQEIEWPIANTSVLKRLYKKKLTTNIREDIRELCQN